MASVDYQNAMFDSIMRDLPSLVRLLPDIPFVDEQSVAMQEIKSPRGRAIILKLLQNAIHSGEAADEARAHVEAKAAEQQKA